MLYNARNCSVKIGDTEIDYVSFGTGKKNLVMIIGLNDGLFPVKGTALPLAIAYRIFASDYTVYVFGRKNKMEEGYSTRDMAEDQAKVMRTLGITQADVIGVSQGGMVAQYLAIDHPELVHKLILAVTLSRQNEIVHDAVSAWRQLALDGDFKNLLISSAEKAYTEQRLKKYRLLYPFLGLIKKPDYLERFLIQANACLTHDAHAELGKISCPTLVIGGALDQIVGAAASRELAKAIKGSKLYIYKDYGHTVYEEAKDFNRRMLHFFQSNSCHNSIAI